MEVDDEKIAKAKGRLKNLIGMSEENSVALVNAVMAGAIDHAFELINGSGPVPTAMTTSKADQLRWICEHAGRLLRQREVEIVFRITPSSAKTIMNTMLATYEESLRAKFVGRMRSDVNITQSGSKQAGLTWTLKFSESGTLDAAASELDRLGLLALADVSVPGRRIIVPQKVTMNGESKDLLGLMGLTAP